jgi:hypothetical protein
MLEGDGRLEGVGLERARISKYGNPPKYDGVTRFYCRVVSYGLCPIRPSESYARCLGRGGSMSELSPDEPSIATAGAARTALTRGRTDLVAARRRDRERKWRASAKAPPAESQHA